MVTSGYLAVTLVVNDPLQDVSAELFPAHPKGAPAEAEAAHPVSCLLLVSLKILCMQDV